jgi:hypothetical protein
MWKASSSLLLYLVLAAPAQAEIHKYVDENGNVTFTDVYKEGAKRIDLLGAPGESSVHHQRKAKPSPVLLSRRKATNVEAGQCLEIHRNDFRDPRSAYVVSATVAEYRMPPNAKGQTTREIIVEIDVSARNGFGGAGRENRYCPIDLPPKFRSPKEM